MPTPDIQLIISDVDGVLTDGGVTFDNSGMEYKTFNIKDGLGIKMWQRSGRHFAVLTARQSQIVETRCGELGVEIVKQGFTKKLQAAIDIASQLGISTEQTCFIGDDLTDLSTIAHVGFGVAVADAVSEIRDAADFVTVNNGGSGAVRELVEVLLKQSGEWENLVEIHYKETAKNA